MKKQNLKAEALVAWRNGQYYECGQALSQYFDKYERQSWATGVLKAAIEGKNIPPVIRNLMSIIEDKSRWAEAKAEFSKIRTETIQMEKKGNELELLGIYHLAENVAKITYNLSGSNGGFDEDSSYWIPYCVNFIASHVGDKARREKIIDSLWWSAELR